MFLVAYPVPTGKRWYNYDIHYVFAHWSWTLSRGLETDERWVRNKVSGEYALRIVARIIYDGDSYPSYMNPPINDCHGTDGAVKFSLDTPGCQCQLLRVINGCTVAFVSYTAGDEVPFGTIHIRSSNDDSVRYIAVTESPAHTGHFFQDIMLLVPKELSWNIMVFTGVSNGITDTHLTTLRLKQGRLYHIDRKVYICCIILSIFLRSMFFKQARKNVLLI